MGRDGDAKKFEQAFGFILVAKEEPRMGKKAIIVVHLVEESSGKANEEIEKEIFEELSKGLPKIPWFKEVETVTVTET